MCLLGRGQARYAFVEALAHARRKHAMIACDAQRLDQTKFVTTRFKDAGEGHQRVARAQFAKEWNRLRALVRHFPQRLVGGEQGRRSRWMGRGGTMRLPASCGTRTRWTPPPARLRESFRVLTAKGLVYSPPVLGTVVKPREDWHLLDPDVLCWLVECMPQSQFFEALTTVRRIFEPAMAFLAATRASQDDIALIQDAYERMEQARDRTEFQDPDLGFHRAIAKATHNFLLVHLSIMLSEALRESIRFTVQRPDVVSHSRPRHKAILNYVRCHHALHPGISTMHWKRTTTALYFTRPAAVVAQWKNWSTATCSTAC